MKIRAKVKGGGAVLFNSKVNAWASYGIHSEILYSGVKLPDGRSVQTFVNRETGLIVVDVIDKGGRGGHEILRRNV